ncbi:MAG TPA: protein translocase subunit SecD [Candidatus Kapabacteria bacterium]|nr:protein translocase subunit SecD [Candidatus Kapabacteria bacterium]
MKQTWSRYLIIFAPLVIAGILLWPTFRSYQLGKEKAAAEASKDTVRINNFIRDNGESYRNAKNSSVKLGLDLQGGMYVMLEVDIVKLIEESALRESVDETFANVIAKTKSETENTDDNVLEVFLRNFKAIAEPKGRSLISFFDIGDSKEISDATIVDKLKRDIDDAVNQAMEVMRQRVDKFGVSEVSIQKQGARRIVLELPGVSNEKEMRDLLSGTARLEFKLVRNNQDIVKALYAADKVLAPKNLADALKDTTKKDTTVVATAANTDSTKVDSTKKDSTATAAAADTTNPYAKLPKDQQAKAYMADHKVSTLLQVLFKNGNQYIDATTQGGFFMTGNIPNGDYLFFATRSGFDQLMQLLSTDRLKGVMPADLQLVRAAKPENTTEKSMDPTYQVYCVKREAELTGDAITDAIPTFDPMDNRPVVSMQMDVDGAERWAAVTGANIKKQIAIVLDDQVYSAPVVQNKIPNGSSQISGMADAKEANLLSVILKAGALKAPVKIVEERVVGPSLGEDNIQSGINASLFAVLLVVAFMVLYYRTGGLVANLAVIINVLLIIAGLAALGGTLTLPGIGGIILTIGMAVDANILIFERIREEIRRGRGMRSAIDEGFSKALSAIVDSNITTALTGIILYFLGTGPIQGFALTLLLGIATTLFTAIIVSRAMLELTMPENGNYNFGQPKDINA